MNKIKFNPRLMRIDRELEELLQPYLDNSGNGFREASKKFARFHKKIKWELESNNKLFNIVLPITIIFGLSYLVILSVL